MDFTVVVPSMAVESRHGEFESTLKKADLVPVPPSEPRVLTPPGKMAMVEMVPLNSFAVSVQWTPPADLYSRRSRSALALARGKLTGGLLAAGQDPLDLPVAGYRLRFWSMRVPVDHGIFLQATDVAEVSQEVTGKEPKLLEETWGPELKQAVLKWLIPNTTYIFQVTAFNAAGEADWSEPSTPFTMPERVDGDGLEFASLDSWEDMKRGSMIPLPQEGRPAYLSKNPDCIELDWTAPCHRGAEIYSYDFLVSEDPKFCQDATRHLEVAGESSILKVDGLVPNRVYYLKHRANNEKGPSQWSEATLGVATRAKPPDRPDAPIRLGDVSQYKPGEVIVKWDCPESYNIPVQHYRVRSSTSPDMVGAVEVPIGDNPARSSGPHGTEKATLSGQLENPDAEEGGELPASPSSPSRRFGRGSFALTQMKIKGLRPSSTYYFQVQAVNQIGESEWSPPSVPMKMVTSPPARVARPRHIDGTLKEGMRICWPVPDAYGDAVITRYDVRVSKHAMMVDAREVRDAPTRPVRGVTLLPGLDLVETTMDGCWEPCKDHFYQVRAASTAGVGDWSESSMPMQVRPERPLRPEAPHHFVCLPRAIVAYWSTPDCQGSPVTSFELRYSTAEDLSRPTMVRGLKGKETEAAVTGLQPHRTYFFQVRCHNDVGASEWSAPSQPEAVQQEPPTKMCAPHRNSVTATSVSVGCVPPADVGTLDGDLVQSYSLRYACGPNRIALIEDKRDREGICYLKGARATGAEIKGLTSGTDIVIQVFAVNEFGEGPPSDWAEFRTESSRPEATDAPLFQLQEISSWSLTLGVKPHHNGGSPFKSFAFEGKDLIKDTIWQTAVWDAHPPDEHGMHYYSINYLSPGHKYQFRAVVSNAIGSSEWSEWSEEVSTMPTVPKSPGAAGATGEQQLLTMGDQDCTSFTVRFAHSSGGSNDNGSPILEYILQWSMDEAFAARVTKETRIRAVDGELSFRCNDCLAGTLCYSRIAAVNAEGAGPFGKPAKITMDADVPVAPAQPRVVSVGIESIKISWLPPHDCGSPVTHFWVNYWETDACGRPEHVRDRGELLIQGKKRFCMLEPLKAGREYAFEVAAENEIGVSPFSDASKPTFTLPPTEPTAPGRPAPVRSTAHSVTVSWNASAAIGTTISNQFLEISSDPTFPVHLTGQAWLSPYRNEEGYGKTRRDVEISPVWHTYQALQVGPSKRAGAPADDQFKMNPNSRPGTVGSASTSYGTSSPTTGITSRPNTVEESSPQKSLLGTSLPSGVLLVLEEEPGPETFEDYDTQVRNITFQAEVSARVFLARLCPYLAECLPTSKPPAKEDSDKKEEPGFYDPEFLEFKDTGPKRMTLLSKEELECHRQKVRRADDTENSGTLSLLKGLKRQQKKADGRTAQYTVYGVQPGTYYYIRVSSLNEIGLGEWSPVSPPLPTGFLAPAPIPEVPGIVLLQKGCCTLTFGWKRSYCWGSPVTKYVVRFGETEESLWEDGCVEFVMEEHDLETWPGMAWRQPSPPPIARDSLEDQEVISTFAEYLMIRFGSLQLAWEWLDVSNDGNISLEEFMEGDVDTGPPFADFSRQDLLLEVWRLMDSDGSGEISMNEFNKLWPYLEAVGTGSAGASYEGVCCLVPNLTPGKSYYIMARTGNAAGVSPWTKCLEDRITTEPSRPVRIDPIESVLERRTANTIVLRWNLPWSGGDKICKIELKYHFQDVEDGIISKKVLASAGTFLTFEEDPTTGEVPTELELPNLLPGQIVTASARGYNSKGGAREFSYLPGPGRGGAEAEHWSWDLCTLCAPPDLPSAPVFEEASLKSLNSSSWGDYTFGVGGRTNGRLITHFDLEVYDENTQVFQTRMMSVTEEESLKLRNGETKMLRGSLQDLLPGQSYCIRARAASPAGASDWTDYGQMAQMPPDVPHDPDAILSDIASLEFIEIKWMPPYNNGALILKYEIRMALDEYAPDQLWTMIDENDLAKSTRGHSSSGRRTLARDEGTLVYRQKGLKDGTAYYFKFRAWNIVGCSGWSEVSRFITKSSKPCKLTDVWVKSKTSREITVEWRAPETQGVPLLRYDLVGGPNPRIVKWCQMAAMLMDATADMDRLFGYKKAEDTEFGEPKGSEDFDKLYCEESMYAPILGTQNELTLKNLIPGQDYFFIARGVASTGKGEFSEVLGPITTESEEPKTSEPMTAYHWDEESCSFWFRTIFRTSCNSCRQSLPYNMGSAIDEIRAVLQRTAGPAAIDELDPQTGDVQAHIAGQEIIAHPAALSCFCSLGNLPRGLRHQGMTSAVRRNFRDEVLDENASYHSGRPATFELCTGQCYMVSFAGLKPGTCYEVTWKCRNEKGWSPVAGGTLIQTHASIPDTPLPLHIAGL